MRGSENTTATWTARWHRHIEWQRQLLVNLAAGNTPPRAPRFLVLRPGDKLTVCDASGMHDLRGQCYRGTPPSRRRPLDGEHWDAFMTSGNAKLMRPLPGLGNVALSLVSAAITAVVSRRVLLLENFSAPAQSFGSPMRDLILESNGWAPHMADAAQLGGMTDSWAAHDDQSAFADLCRANLRSWPPSRVWRIWSNQYFAPLLLLNPHHALHVEAMAEVLGARSEESSSGGGAGERSLWTPAIRSMWVPRPELLAELSGFAIRHRLDVAPFVAMHVRMPLKAKQMENVARCARERLAANNASILFLATLFGANRRMLKQSLSESGHALVWFGRTLEAQAESKVGTDAALADMWLMGRAREVMVNAGSTFGYVAQGLSGGRATRYGGTHTSAQFVGNVGPNDCRDVGTTEASFHLLPQATRASTACRAGEREARRRSSALYASSTVKH